jgi:hypothetical protein
MQRVDNLNLRRFVVILLMLCIAYSLNLGAASAQTTGFTYQGKLSDSGTPANSNYDFQFKLFDLPTGGTQQGTTVTLNSVAVTNGIFAVNLDFGATAFPGADRFLEISLKPAGSAGGYQQLLPRQPLTSTPYAIKSLNAATADGLTVACINCVTSSQIQSVQGSQITGAIPVGSVPPGNGNYIQNSTNQQASANFNISGNGTAAGTLNANIVNVTTQYNLGAQRLLGVSGAVGFASTNIFAGIGAGAANTPDASGNGNYNSFFGNLAGQNNTTGYANSFIGNSAGFRNTTEHNNTFIGYLAGLNNGLNDTLGIANANTFVGNLAGRFNTTGASNVFFGDTAGYNNSSGFSNAFFGSSAGAINQTGFYNTALGAFATEGSGDLTNATSIGAFSYVTQSNSLVLGSVNGINSATADTSVGIGTTSPAAPLHVVRGLSGGTVNTGVIATLERNGTGYLQLLTPNANESGVLLGNVSNSAAGGILYNNSATPNGLQFRTNGNATRMVIAASGNVGLGTNTPAEKLDIAVNSGHILLGDPGCLGGFNGIGFGSSLTGCANYSLLGNGTDTIINRPTGGSISFREANAQQMSIAAGGAVTVNGTLAVFNISAPGSIPLCYDGITSRLAQCSSSLRYKTNIAPYRAGLEVINRLKPITFDWKAGGMHDLGFGAEEVATVDPLLVTYNRQGEIEGVKYDRISAALVNAVKEQQIQIEEMQKQLIALKKLLCSTQPQTSVCQ